MKQFYYKSIQFLKMIVQTMIIMQMMSIFVNFLNIISLKTEL